MTMVDVNEDRICLPEGTRYPSVDSKEEKLREAAAALQRPKRREQISGASGRWGGLGNGQEEVETDRWSSVGEVECSLTRPGL